MKLPWVSRELHERVVEELRASEMERKALLDRLLAVSGVSPIEGGELAVAEVSGQPRNDAPAKTEPMQLTIGAIRAAAQAAANRRAGRVG